MGAEKHENQTKGCGVELRVSDLQMNAWTWRVYDTVKARIRGTRGGGAPYGT